MEVTKRKILLENSTDRTFNSPTWGVITATTFYINVMLTQNMDDMGLFADMNYISHDNTLDLTIPSNYNTFYGELITKLNLSGITFPFMSGILPGPMTGITGTTKNVLRLTGAVESDYYNYGNLPITGATDSKIEDVKTYNTLLPYIVGFNTGAGTYTGYTGAIINGVNRVSALGEPSIYVFDTPADPNLGTPSQISGLQYQDYTGITRNIVINGESIVIPVTNFRSIGEGWNQTNVSLSAITKEEYLFGIISPPEVQSDVFIDRGITTVMDNHLRLSEIKDLEMLVAYGNGFYNLTKQ